VLACGLRLPFCLSKFDVRMCAQPGY
jgi:hypothetical protein